MLVKSRPVAEQVNGILVRVVGIGGGNLGVGKAGLLGDEIDDIHAEAIYTLLEPEFHNLMHRLDNGGALPVEVRLFGSKQMEIVLCCGLVVGPGTSCGRFSQLQ
jgi:hypothetical protein